MQSRRRPAYDRRASADAVRRRGPHKSKAGVYLRRRAFAVSVILLSILALVLAALVQETSGGEDRALPINPNNVGPDAVLAEAAGVVVSTPIRPESLTGLGYHPEGESLVEMSPRGRNLTANPVLALFADGSTPEELQYYVMDPASRQGPSTGALDVGAEAGTAVYAPVTGTVIAIRPDPVLQKGANVVEIKPTDNPALKVSISLVGNIQGGVGPKSSVVAGITQLGSVADSKGVLKPQLASYTSDADNHVTVSAIKTN